MLNFGNKEFRNLQEQVLQNARDIATLKGIENLKIVIVEELPEVGNPYYIYLVPSDGGEEPDVYEEYIWLADEERYEKIGGVSIDLTNYVTVDTEQTVTGKKTFDEGILLSANNKITETKPNQDYIVFTQNNAQRAAIGNVFYVYTGLMPGTNNQRDLGASNLNWKDFYLNGSIDFGNGATIKKDASNRVALAYGGTDVLKIGASGGYTYILSNLTPENNNTYDLGRSTYCWKDIYIAGNISDGINSITVANISTKVTSTYASGTFDANGESTIDTEQAGTPEGLFIFTYGNCQCFLRLTATMVNSADATPIRIACPMIYNSGTVNGWLNISRSSDTLTISVIDGTNHVDSGYAWTLTKTNLI